MPVLSTRGAHIHYSKAGAGPAILLIQGVGVSGEGWRPQIGRLGGQYTVYAFDNRGMSASTLEDGSSLTIDEMADDALAIMNAEGVHQFHVVGHSMGGLIAQALTLTARDRVRSLALLCTFVRGADGARLDAATIVTGLRIRIGTKRMRRNAFLELIMPSAYLRTVDRSRLAEELGLLFGYHLASQPYFVMRQLRAMARYDAAARWPELADIPALVVSATHDRISLPKYGRRLATLIPRARFIELPDAGHGMTIQCANEINALLEEHFAAAEIAVDRCPTWRQPAIRPRFGQDARE